MKTKKKIKKRKKELLLVEDNSGIAFIYTDFLVEEGFQVTNCENGLEALNILKKNPNKFHLIITDQAMPVMNGHELCIKLHQLDIKIPIILMTGLSHEDDLIKFKSIGISKLFKKPLELDDLLESINELLK